MKGTMPGLRKGSRTDISLRTKASRSGLIVCARNRNPLDTKRSVSFQRIFFAPGTGRSLFLRRADK